MRIGRAALLLAIGAIVAGPGTAAAQTPLPVKEADGVRLVRGQIVFTPSATKLWRRVAGRLVDLECTEFVKGGAHGGGIGIRVPKRGRSVWAEGLPKGADYCDVSIVRRRTDSEELLVSIPLTQRGAVYVDEREKSGQLFSVLVLAGFIGVDRGVDGAATAEELFAGRPRLREILVPLEGPTGTPPADRVGYWSDGARHVAVVTLSASGRRLFIEYEGDVLHTNVAGHIFGS